MPLHFIYHFICLLSRNYANLMELISYPFSFCASSLSHVWFVHSMIQSIRSISTPNPIHRKADICSWDENAPFMMNDRNDRPTERMSALFFHWCGVPWMNSMNFIKIPMDFSSSTTSSLSQSIAIAIVTKSLSEISPANDIRVSKVLVCYWCTFYCICLSHSLSLSLSLYLSVSIKRVFAKTTHLY